MEGDEDDGTKCAPNEGGETLRGGSVEGKEEAPPDEACDGGGSLLKLNFGSAKTARSPGVTDVRNKRGMDYSGLVPCLFTNRYRAHFPRPGRRCRHRGLCATRVCALHPENGSEAHHCVAAFQNMPDNIATTPTKVGAACPSICCDAPRIQTSVLESHSIPNVHTA